MSIPIEKISVGPIKGLFVHEAHHLTVWLADNIEALGDRIGLCLTVVSREADVGDFRLDLECTSDDGRRVIVENQLGRTDHDHLGKLLTYLVNLEAGAAVWVAAELRAEHKRVIDWLNRNTPEGVDFYLVKIEAISLGTSKAPLFTLLAGPDEQGKKIGVKIKQWAEQDHERYRFWEQFIARSATRSKLFANLSPTRDSWISGATGRAGVRINPAVNKDEARVDLYIDFGKNQKEKNKVAFDKLFAQKDTIELEFGGPLEWLRLKDNQASIIRKRFPDSGYQNTAHWATIQDHMIDCASRMEVVFKTRVAGL